MSKKSHDQKVKIMMDFFLQQNLQMDSPVTSDQLYQAINNRMPGRTYDWTIFEQIWQRMQKSNQFDPQATSNPQEFIEYFLTAEENLETCILREKENIDYLQQHQNEPNQQQTQDQNLQVLVDNFLAPQGGILILKVELTYLQQKESTTHKKLEDGCARWNEILNINKNINGGNLVLQVIDNQGNIIGNTQFESNLIQDLDIHQEELRLFDSLGNQSEMVLNCSFQLMRMAGDSNYQKVEEVRELLNKAKGDLSDYENDLFLLKEPFVIAMTTSIHSNKQQNNNMVISNNNDINYQVQEPQYQKEYEQTEPTSPMHTNFLIILIIWVICNMFVNFQRTVFLDFMLCSYVLQQFYVKKLHQQKLLLLLMLFIISVFFDIIWLILFTDNLWTGPDIKTNVQTNNMFEVKKVLNRFVVFMSFVLLIVKGIAIVIAAIIYQSAPKKGEMDSMEEMNQQHQ